MQTLDLAADLSQIALKPAEHRFHGGQDVVAPLELRVQLKQVGGLPDVVLDGLELHRAELGGDVPGAVLQARRLAPHDVTDDIVVGVPHEFGFQPALVVQESREDVVGRGRGVARDVEVAQMQKIRDVVVARIRRRRGFGRRAGGDPAPVHLTQKLGERGFLVRHRARALPNPFPRGMPPPSTRGA